MTLNFETIPLIKNETESRFELEINGKYAFITFRKFGNQIALIHTETDPELAGKGVASALVEKTLEYLEAHHLALLPMCPYVFAYIQRHKAWKRLVSPTFKGYDKL